MTPERLAWHRRRHAARVERARRGELVDPPPLHQPARPEAALLPTDGPGTRMRKMLARIGIQPKGRNCQCNEHALEMDRRGADWCEANLETIVDWLEAEARKRPLVGILFSRTAARALVKLAISQARSL